MKALSVKQPWAFLIAEKYKSIETRKWATDYRGPLLIVASKSPDKYAMRHFNEELRLCAPHEIIFGKAIAVVDLVDCRKMTVDDQNDACCDIYSGAYSWCLKNVQKIKPFAVKGQLGLYEVNQNYELCDND